MYNDRLTMTDWAQSRIERYRLLCIRVRAILAPLLSGIDCQLPRGQSAGWLHVQGMALIRI